MNELVHPIWEDLIVPFNEVGIWEATLLYIAPKLMPGFWHWAYARIEPVTSDFSFISKCQTIDDYVQYVDSYMLHPTVFLISENTAHVRFAAWGWNGLGLWSLEIMRDGESIRVVDTTGPIYVIHYPNSITL